MKLEDTATDFIGRGVCHIVVDYMRAYDCVRACESVSVYKCVCVCVVYARGKTLAWQMHALMTR